MFVPIENSPRAYEWGSRTAIAGLLGREPSGGPEAELWLGAHPGSPARIVGGETEYGTLADWVAADAASAGLTNARLPFLLKLLAADAPLSLQAHPSPEQAATGFARENAAGVPVDAANRNYKDAFHKPELIFALSDTFDALCGFRPVAHAVADLDALIEATPDAATLHELRSRLDGDDASVLRDVVRHLLSDDVGELVAAVSDAAARAPLTPATDTIRLLAGAYPGDPGVVVSLFINRVTLRRGEVLYLPAGNIHAYLQGFGVELMASSDNVLRGGLTPKHVDVPELLSVLEFEPLPVPYLEPVELGGGVSAYRPDVPDFELIHVVPGDADASVQLPGAAIVVATRGRLSVVGGRSATELVPGGVIYVTPDEVSLTVSGEGELFVATTRL